MDIDKVFKELSDYMEKVRSKEARENLDYLLNRLQSAKDVVNRGKDPAGMECGTDVVGENILKTWRISGENFILSSINGDSSLQSYLNIRKHILESAKKILGVRFNHLYEMEKASSSIYTYLLEAGTVFLKASGIESGTEPGENLKTMSEVFNTLAYKIYNAFDLDGRFVSYREVVKDSREIYNLLRQAQWDREFAGDVSEEFVDVSRVCREFGKMLSIYIDQDSSGKEKSGYNPLITET